MRFCAVCCAIIFLVGCAAVPKVQYAEYNWSALGKQENYNQGYPFRHPRSVIKLELMKKENEDVYYIQATTVPYDFNSEGDFSTLYRIWGVDDYFSTTNLKISYIPNTKIINTIHFTTKDNVGVTITKVGNIAVSLIPLLTTPFLAFGPGVHFEPTVLDPVMMKLDQWTRDPINKDYCFRLRNIRSEPSFSLKNYVKDGNGKWQSTFPVPTCSAGVVDIALCSSQNILAIIPIRFVEPDKIIPVNLPLSGRLDMDPICGAQVNLYEDQNQNGKRYLDQLKTLLDQIQAIKDAHNPPPKNSGGGQSVQSSNTSAQEAKK